MKIEVTIPDGQLADLDEYADWYLSRLRFRKKQKVVGTSCRVVDDERDRTGLLDLQNLTILWDDDGEEEDVEAKLGITGDWTERLEDFDCSALVWGDDTSDPVTETVLWRVP